MSVGSTRGILLSASAVLTMLACTSDDTPTDPSTNQTAAAAATAYRAVDLGTLGGNNSIAYAINRQNQVVGEAGTAFNQTHAFLWSGNTMRDLGTLGGNFSRAFGINDAGQVVGSAALGGPSGEHHPFLWTNGLMQDLGTLGGGFGEATAINSAGQVVGGSSVTPGANNHAFLWSNGTMIDLGTLGGDYSYARGISPTGDVVGESKAANGHLHAFLWSHGKMTDLDPKGAKSQAYAINRSGRIAGNSAGTPRMTIWVNGKKRLQGLATGVSAGYGLNAAGLVVGTQQVSGANQATLWKNGTPTVLRTFSGAKSNAQAFAINAANEVVGSSEALGTGGGEHATLWTLK